MTPSSPKYPIGIQTFEKIRKGNYIYVDKTELVYDLANSGKYFFIARPRRFGKSMLLSTMAAYFEGKRELFDGLAIASLEKDWTPIPVFLLSLARYDKSRPETLDSLFATSFAEWEAKYGITKISDSISDRFRTIIRTAYEQTGQQVAILIDEYDAPLVAHIDDEETHSKVRSLLKSVYVNLKDMDGCIRFAILTGVSRFSRTTIFSGLNNLKDITFDDRYSTICGITEAELRENFQIGIEKLGEKLDTDYTGALLRLKENYDGYHFTKSCPDLYNPFSLLNALDSSEIGSYWFESGTPTFLFEAIRNTDRFLPELFTEEADIRMLSNIDTYKTDPIALMFQTGYLTIKGYDPEMESYRLGIPNQEVRQGLSHGLLDIYMDATMSDTTTALFAIRRAFMYGKPADAMEHIKTFLAGIPYELAGGKDEIYFENNLYLLFNLIGIRAKAEYHTCCGRIDLLLEMPKFIYVMELKLDGTPKEALAQIDEKGYALPFADDPRPLYRIGINFSRQTRNIDSWIIRP